MNTRDLRQEWMCLWEQLQAQADASRDSQRVAFELLRAYNQLSADERPEVHPLLADWLASGDNRRRYDARFLIAERAIRGLAPAVASTIDWLKELPGPEARYEVKSLQQLQEELTR